VDEKADLEESEGPSGRQVTRTPSCSVPFAKIKRGERQRWIDDVDVAMNIRMEGGKPVPSRIVILSYAGTDWVRQLEEIDWDQTLAWAITQEATNQRSDPDVAALISPYRRKDTPDLLSIHEEVTRSLRTAQRKNGVTAERLEEVLRLYDKHGIEGVMQATGKSRSYAYQLLARARKELR
jgi:hypothetical protein